MQRVPLGLSSTLFSCGQIQRAREVRKLRVVVGHPSDYTLIYMLDHQCIVYCIYVGLDVRNALVILGVCQTCMAGKSSVRLHVCRPAHPPCWWVKCYLSIFSPILQPRKQLGPGWCG